MRGSARATGPRLRKRFTSTFRLFRRIRAWMTAARTCGSSISLAKTPSCCLSSEREDSDALRVGLDLGTVSSPCPETPVKLLGPQGSRGALSHRGSAGGQGAEAATPSFRSWAASPVPTAPEPPSGRSLDAVRERGPGSVAAPLHGPTGETDRVPSQVAGGDAVTSWELLCASLPRGTWYAPYAEGASIFS